MKVKCNLVIKLFKDYPDSNTEYRMLYGNYNGIFDNLGAMDFNDVVTSALVYKGPDFVAGDVFRLFNGLNFSKTHGFIDLAPRKDPYYLNISPFVFNDVLSSLKVINQVQEMEMKWTEPIYCIIELFDQKNFLGKKRIVLNSEPDLSKLGFDNRVSSAIIYPGPAYTATDGYVNFFDMKNFQSHMHPGNQRPANENTPLKISDLGVFSDKISSIQITKAKIVAAVPV
jgi:hypothetical protein